MHRHGSLELLLVLPDDTNSLILASWTDLRRPAESTSPSVRDRGRGRRPVRGPPRSALSSTASTGLASMILPDGGGGVCNSH